MRKEANEVVVHKLDHINYLFFGAAGLFQMTSTKIEEIIKGITSKMSFKEIEELTLSSI